MSNLTPDIINAAIEGFEAQKRRIDEQIAELRAMLLGPEEASASRTVTGSTRKRKFSAASRQKMALAQKARWAKLRGDTEPIAIAEPKQERKLSEEGRKRIIAATKKRWRLQKAAARARGAGQVRRAQVKPRRALPAPAEA